MGVHEEMLADLRDGAIRLVRAVDAEKYKAALAEIHRLSDKDVRDGKPAEGIVMDDDGVFRCKACTNLDGIIAARDEEIAKLRKMVDYDGTRDAGNPAIEYERDVPVKRERSASAAHTVAVEEMFKVHVVFVDGEQADGLVTAADMERIREGKLQTFTLTDVYVDTKKRRARRIVRFWSVKYVYVPCDDEG